jgi:uncharacterized phage protein gp47/JayE
MSLVSATWGGITFFTQQQVAAVQGQATSAPVDASQGSVTLALVEATNGVALWLQAQTIATVLLTRASTSTGPDLDTWMADWNFTRLSAVAATGYCTFGRFTTTGTALVPVGTIITSSIGGPQFQVIADSTNTAYSSAKNGYPMAAGIGSVVATVQAVTAGTAGNAAANTITYFQAPVSGVDTVNNPTALTSGQNAELDAAFRSRFILYIQSLREATINALYYWILSIQSGLTANIVEGYTSGGTPDPGFFYAVVDDGSGNPPTSLVTAASLVVNAHRAAGISYAVYGPSILTVNVSATITTATNTSHSAAVAAATAAVQAYLNTVPVGATLSYARLYQVIFDASTSITDATNLLLNGGSGDIVPTGLQVVKYGTVTIA